jgi:8-oxo-dGTP diphosphatase
MISLINSSTAFLRRGNDYLLIKRAANREIAPGVWSGAGGKLKCAELNDPLSACVREIHEETGIAAGQIHDLSLRYIIIRRYRDTIRLSYVSFGNTDAEPSVKTEEGAYHWVPENEMLSLTYTAAFAAMLDHYIHTPNEKCVLIGVAGNSNGRCKMAWSVLEDFNEI